MSDAAIRRAVYERGHSGMRLGLERSRAAARLLGDPQAGLRVFHVAGSNGKGSTSAMLERIAREAGLRTGLYTSPHLSKLSERVRINGEPIEDAAFDAALGRVLRDAPDELTFFETLTLAAFVALRDANVDIAVLEVGLGGRLDATNLVLRPLATGITSITSGEHGKHLEHESFLGDTAALIAREKAGIAKRGVPLLLGPLEPDAHAAVLEAAREVGATPVLDAAVGESATGAFLRLPSAVSESGGRIALRPRLRGRHQLENAAVAAAMVAVSSAATGIAHSAIERGIALATWPGRLEAIEHEGRTVLLDAAHNIEGVRALVQAVPELGLDPARTVLVFGALADKPFESMLRALLPLARARVYAPPEGRAPAPLAALTAIADGEACDTPGAALTRGLSIARRGETVLVTGSIYFIGAIRAQLLGIVPDPPIAL